MFVFRHDPTHGEARNNWGVLIDAVYKDPKKARKIYEDALEVCPDLVQIHYNLGNLLDYRFGEKDQAFECYQKCLELDPKFVAAHYNLGVLYEYHFRDRVMAKKVNSIQRTNKRYCFVNQTHIILKIL